MTRLKSCLGTRFRDLTGVVYDGLDPQAKELLFAERRQPRWLWDVTSAKCLLTFEGHNNSVFSSAFSPDGRSIVSADDGTLRLWDVESGQEIRTITGHCQDESACVIIRRPGVRMPPGVPLSKPCNSKGYRVFVV